MRLILLKSFVLKLNHQYGVVHLISTNNLTDHGRRRTGDAHTAEPEAHDLYITILSLIDDM